MITFSTSDVAVCCSSDFSQLGRALLLRLEQAHVLDRYHCLVGECCDEINLLLGE